MWPNHKAGFLGQALFCETLKVRISGQALFDKKTKSPDFKQITASRFCLPARENRCFFKLTHIHS